MAISTYAVVQNSRVINLVLWDGAAEWEAPEGTSAVPVPVGEPVDIGFAYDGKSFSKAE